ncbi:MAG: hypothetical protein R3C25_11780 [Hyphomonadaceae bacterium]
MIGQPTLLCLNMRREQFANVRTKSFGGVAETMEAARAGGWRVLHAHTRRAPSPALGQGTLPGFEPRANEAVIALPGADVFSDAYLMEAGRSHRPDCLHLIGAMFSRCGLASILAAQEARLPVNIIGDACVTPDFEPIAAEQVLRLAAADAATRVVSHCPSVVSGGENVICLESWRT